MRVCIMFGRLISGSVSHWWIKVVSSLFLNSLMSFCEVVFVKWALWVPEHAMLQIGFILHLFV